VLLSALRLLWRLADPFRREGVDARLRPVLIGAFISVGSEYQTRRIRSRRRTSITSIGLSIGWIASSLSSRSAFSIAKGPANRHIVLSVQTPRSSRLHKRVFEEGRNSQKRPQTPSRGHEFKPFSAASRPTANPACDYTKWPEVKLLRSRHARLHETGLVREHDRLHAVAEVELREEPRLVSHSQRRRSASHVPAFPAAALSRRSYQPRRDERRHQQAPGQHVTAGLGDREHEVCASYGVLRAERYGITVRPVARRCARQEVRNLRIFDG
jgi:hypothetical protein